MSRPRFSSPSKWSERAARSLRASERPPFVACDSTHDGLRCSGTAGHQLPHWCWTDGKFVKWEDEGK
jgi:hypothetical protein